jgi:hypothetical protein
LLESFHGGSTGLDTKRIEAIAAYVIESAG